MEAVEGMSQCDCLEFNASAVADPDCIADFVISIDVDSGTGVRMGWAGLLLLLFIIFFGLQSTRYLHGGHTTTTVLLLHCDSIILGMLSPYVQITHTPV